MTIRIFSQRLGAISDEQFQAALDRFQPGKFVQAEPVPFGLWGQNVFVSSDTGYMLLDRLIIWSFLQRNGTLPWNEEWTFREWASRYVLFEPKIDIS